MNQRNYLRKTVISLLLLIAVFCPSIAFGQTSGIGFLYIDRAEVPQGESQQIVVVADEPLPLTNAQLFYSVYDETFEIRAVSLHENAALFEIPALKIGSYQLNDVVFETETESQRMPIADNNTTSVTFDCVQEAERSLLSEGSSDSGLTVYTLNEDNEITTSDTPIINQLSAENDNATTRSLNKGNLTIALDPGHGGFDPGAVYFNLREKDLTLKIATYCKQFLEQYHGVSLYMTRSTDVALGSNTSEDLKNRVYNSVGNGADVIVSLHINSGGGNGAEVYYPNGSSWKHEETHGQGKVLAQNILDKLVGLGLTNRGIKIRDYGTGGSYADGSMADYYAILRHARTLGIPAIIVEHAFIDNPADFDKLANESWIKGMGEADAQGIAQTYGLVPSGSCEWKKNNGAWQYYLNGRLQKGWFMAAGSWYYANGKGDCLTGWQNIDGKWYYLDPINAFMHRSWLTVGGKTYYLNYSGDMAQGWKNIDTKRYYFLQDGQMATGVQTIDGEIWEFGTDGALIVKSGWRLENGKWYFYINGKLNTGWLLDRGQWYFLNSDGSMATGWYLVANRWYYSNASGVMLTGWQRIGNYWYYLENSGAMKTGWLLSRGSWYWLKDNGAMAVGLTDVQGKRYFFSDSGSMLTGWHLASGNWYLFGGSGEALAGWQSIGGSWYYLRPSTNIMLTGWYNVGGAWYYSQPNGAMATGWLKLGSTWYYLQGSGAMATGWQLINGTWYLFDSSGAMTIGWGNDGTSWSRFTETGAWAGYGEGWQLINGSWYYLKTGVPATGWSLIGGTWYLHSTTGVMLTGWQELNGSRYYLYPSGAMATGWTSIGNSYEYFQPSGAWNQAKSQQLIPILNKAIPEKSLTIQKMTRAYLSTGATYPEKELREGGAPSIKAFCDILYEEAAAEEVDPRVLFSQVMLETGYLRFGGSVRPEQYNFGGLGATDGGGKPASFKDVRTGLRAQTQHLKAYATANPILANACVDPRFRYVRKGSAPYVQHLGIQENPQHVGWASAKEYGIRIVSMIQQTF